MSFKNAFKNLVAHFGVVWSILLYMLICSAILVGLSIPFILPIAEAFADAGVFDAISDAFSAMLGEGGWNALWDGLYVAYGDVVSVFNANGRIASLVTAFFVFVVIVAFRFFFGLYEIPLATVLDGRMSCNAAYGFGGKFFSTLGVSIRFSLAKMPIMISFDAASFGLIYGMVKLIGFNVALPFVIILILLSLRALRSSMTACWAPAVVGGMGVIKGFARSVSVCFRRFGSIYSTYFVTWMLFISVGLFVTIFTLGVGLMIVFPFGMAMLGYIGITVFYNKTGKRYYIDGAVYTPPAENAV